MSGQNLKAFVEGSCRSVTARIKPECLSAVKVESCGTGHNAQVMREILCDVPS